MRNIRCYYSACIERQILKQLLYESEVEKTAKEGGSVWSLYACNVLYIQQYNFLFPTQPSIAIQWRTLENVCSLPEYKMESDMAFCSSLILLPTDIASVRIMFFLPQQFPDHPIILKGWEYRITSSL